MYKTATLSGAALIAFLAAGVLAQAQTQSTDIPNLSSADFGWQPMGGGFRPVEGKAGPTSRSGVSKDGERIADENNPNLTPWAASVVKMHNDMVRNGHRAFAAQSRCWPGGTPGQLLFVAQPVYFIQTPNEVWMIWERDHQVRRVYLNREHSANPTPGWFGESVGHYESGELVIDTRGFVEHPLSFVDNMTTPHTKELHVVERWKITDAGNGLQATITVEDPAAFKAPWSAMVRWRKQEKVFAETSCAENNLGYEQFFERDEYPMPIAKTLDF